MHGIAVRHMAKLVPGAVRKIILPERVKNQLDGKRNLRQIHNINSNEIEPRIGEDVEHYSLGLLNMLANDNGWYQEFEILGTVVKFKLDTGAQINVILSQLAEKLELKYYRCNKNIKITNYGGTELVNTWFMLFEIKI